MRQYRFQATEPFTLESGAQLHTLDITYHTAGTLNSARDNVIWVCHALTANSDVSDWWAGVYGPGKLLDPERYFIVCANIVGSPYGTTNPLSTNPLTEQPYYLSFPQVTVRDWVNAHRLLAAHLGLDHIHLLIGGSVGGQQALEWALSEPQRIHHLVVLATSAVHSPWGIAFNESQRMAIAADSSFYTAHPQGGAAGLKAARSIALLSYRGYEAYSTTQGEHSNAVVDEFRAASYQRYQGDKLVLRFNAYSYWFLSKAMDSHNLARNRQSIEHALQQITARTLVIAIDSDLLFPPQEQRFLATQIPDATYTELRSAFGHDGFLIETSAIEHCVQAFLSSDRQPAESDSLSDSRQPQVVTTDYE